MRWLGRTREGRHGQALAEYALLAVALLIGMAIATRGVGALFANSFDHFADALAHSR